MNNDELKALLDKTFMQLSEKERNQEEVYFFDSNGNSTTKENASSVIIRETDQNGELVSENFANIIRNNRTKR